VTAVSALLLEGPDHGARLVFKASPRAAPVRYGALGSVELERAIEEFLGPGLERLGGGGKEAGTFTVPLPSGSKVSVYLELHRPPVGLLIVGAGHLAEPLHRVGALLGFHVTVADDRPEFAQVERFPLANRVVRVDFRDPFREIPPSLRSHVLLVTRGHQYDYECLRLLLREDPLPEYLGMIGSRRRVRATYHQLLEEGIPKERLGHIRAPVGLDVGAETPAEIALAVAAEWVQMRRGGSGRPLTEVERVADRFFKEIE
jgi:xanthine dehydrogenase accessory factor